MSDTPLPINPTLLPAIKKGQDGIQMAGQTTFNMQVGIDHITMSFRVKLTAAADRAIAAEQKAAKAATAEADRLLKESEEEFKKKHGEVPAEVVERAKAVAEALRWFHPDAAPASAADAPGRALWDSGQAAYTARVYWSGGELRLGRNFPIDPAVMAIRDRMADAHRQAAEHTQAAHQHRLDRSKVGEKAEAVTAEFVMQKLKETGESQVLQISESVLMDAASDMGIAQYLKAAPALPAAGEDKA